MVYPCTDLDDVWLKPGNRFPHSGRHNEIKMTEVKDLNKSILDYVL